ncbi:type IV secretion system protein TraC [Thiobacillus denitrificans]|mgnify:CR=1 FL=1|uniref:type IV secretion system protein TraC n=1 Tax=Thiobacillus denitrificans TaxID=36861 RepID=UPI0003632F21|nr:type IV secretion system protein TraC [Thiobacillus denitrificans]
MGAAEILNKIREFVSPSSAADTPDPSVMAGYMPPSLSQQAAFLQHYTLADLLPYESYDPDSNAFVNVSSIQDKKTGERPKDSFGFIIECVPLSGANEEVSRILSSIMELGLPDNACIQVLMYGSPHVRPWMQKWANARVSGHEDEHSIFTERREDNVYRTLSRRRVEYLMQGTGKSLFPEIPYVIRDLQLFISVMFPGEMTEHGVNLMNSARDSISSTLSTAGIPNRNMGVNDFLNLMDEILSGGKADGRVEWDPLRLLRTQVPSAEDHVLIDRDGMVIGEKAVRSLRIRSYPREFWLGGMSDMIGDMFQGVLQIPCPFLFTLNIQVPDQEIFKRTLDFKAARAVQNAEGQLSKYVPIFKDQAEEWRHVQKAIASGQSVIRMTHALTVFTELGQGDRIEQMAKSLFRSKGWLLERASMMQFPTMMSCLPLSFTPSMADDLKTDMSLRTQLQSNAVNTMPVIGEWKGTPSPSLMMFGRRGQINFVDFFDNDQGNYNVAVSAKSGAGKSFFLNEVVTSTVGTGGRAWIIDVGRSYMNTTKVLGGQFIEFSADKDICINPFPLVNDIDEELPLLKSVICQMASPSRPTDDLENSYVEQAIRKVWQEYEKDGEVTAVAELLLGHKDERANDLGHMLFPYTRKGVYSRFFEGRTCIQFEKPLITLELEELKSKRDLQSVVLLIVMMQIQQTMYLGDRSQRKVCVLDEAWDLFSNAGNAASFIETGYRRVRKYGGSFITATQNIEDYYRSPAAKAALDNSDWICLLAQSAESIEKLASDGKLYLDEHKKRLLRSVHTVHGKYSEVAIKGPHGIAINRLIVDPFSATLYSTKAEDFARIQQLTRAGMTTTKAIEKLTEEKLYARNH